MKVLYYHQHFSTPKGSIGNRSYAMSKALIKRGHQVTVVCGSYSIGSSGLQGAFHRGKRAGIVDGIHVIELALPYSNSDGFIKRSITFLKFAWRSSWIALHTDADLIFATSTPLTAGLPGLFGRWLRRKPFVLEIRDLWPELPKEMGVITNPLVLGAMSFLECVSYRSAKRLIGLSPGIVDGIVRRGVPRENIDMIPNGCDLDIFARPAQPWRPDGVLPADLLAIYTGAHGMANGLDAVLDVAKELKSRSRHDIKLVLVGDGKLKLALQARAEDQGLDNVIFHPPVPKTKLAGLMAAADLGMQLLANVPAFYYGTSPNKFFDYIAAGLPVLNNYPGWLADIIQSRNCGYAIPPDDPVAFADALVDAADARMILREMGERSVRLARDSFDRAILSTQFVDALEEATR